jgi:hypothetical protein
MEPKSLVTNLPPSLRLAISRQTVNAGLILLSVFSQTVVSFFGGPIH